MSDLLTIEPNSWPGFRGLFFKDDSFRYIIDDHIHQANNLILAGRRLNNGEIMEYSLDYIFDEYQQCPSFTIHTTCSDVLILYMGSNFMIYQQLADGQFIELIPRQGQYQEITNIFTIIIPLLGGHPSEDYQLPRLNLRQSDLSTIREFMNSKGQEDSDLDEILRMLNPLQDVMSNKFIQSYEALLRQLYGL